ncbi:putative E3 ubiquitin-protein ligase [Sesbania bispinosa]|nr:putative E3 ubiquitin-protein ligase [Sesbania bispinosa]
MAAVNTHMKDVAAKEKGKTVQVAEHVKSQQPIRTWVRKRPRRDGEGSSGGNVEMGQKGNQDVEACITPCDDLGLKSKGAQVSHDQERPTIFSWPDGVCTSLPLGKKIIYSVLEY